ncbi:hypothetical protein [Pseudomonas sp. 24 E 1]|jgi:hypothetical protein|nr:hypothetical protein [Pseudomonas sp. 24 E 1]VVN68021.1 hypothetical protein PS834_00225 [Pseudomonas fluorescens]VVN71577.1 hypothetical protein PS720_00460 [Pseudomonas fluorescens]VVP49363.1 hypothetical protein PS843_05219 [Pseudomonas fluorescens]
MNGEAIQSDTLSALVSQHAIRETVVVPYMALISRRRVH